MRMITALELLESRQLLSTSPAPWRIDGTPAADHIIIRASNEHPGRIEAIVNGVVAGSRLSKNLLEVLIKSGRGDDQIDVQLGSKDADLHFRLYGGRGNDSITAGPGRDILVGGDGADHLNGGKDHIRDILVRDASDILTKNSNDLVRTDRRQHPPAESITPPEDRPLDTSDAATLEEGINRFAFDLYSLLARQSADKNIFFSPYSIATALGMLADSGPTGAASVAALLHRPQDTLFASFAELLDRWQANPSAPYELNLANAGWFSDILPLEISRVLEEYGQRLAADFAAFIQRLDFSDNTAAAKTINDWISRQTNGRIPELIPASALNKYTSFVLTNAIYFKGQWENGFDKKLTRSQPFHLPDGTTKKVAMMYQKDAFNYFANDQLQLIELPYKGDDLSMVVLLPRANDGLQQLRTSLSTDNINHWLNQAYKRDVYVHLPRFKMDNRFPLLESMLKLGLNSNVPELASTISEIIHQANIEVNEEGTVAAAATAIIGAITTCVCSPPAPPTFRADHPFLYAIRDRKTGGLLFLGQETAPAQAPADMPTGSILIPNDNPQLILEPILKNVTFTSTSPLLEILA